MLFANSFRMDLVIKTSRTMNNIAVQGQKSDTGIHHKCERVGTVIWNDAIIECTDGTGKLLL